MVRLSEFRLLVVGAVVALGLTACGAETTVADPAAGSESTSSSPAPSPTPSASPSQSEPVPDGPSCAKVWREGARLPRFYSGCVQDGQWIKRDSVGCSSGQRLAFYADSYYAVLGGEINHGKSPLRRDPGYRTAVQTCRG